MFCKFSNFTPNTNYLRVKKERVNIKFCNFAAAKAIMRMDSTKILPQLFGTFFRIGAFTFGGGWAMISLIEREIVEKRGWIKREEFLDQLAVAQSLPGLLAVNISVAVGDKLRGLRGSLAAAAGTILPSFIIILAIAVFLNPESITSSPTLSAIFKGIRPVVVALIVAPVITSAKAAKLTWRTLWIPAVVAVAIWSKLPVVSNPILYIVVAALAGWLLTARSRRALAGRKEDEGK